MTISSPGFNLSRRRLLITTAAAGTVSLVTGSRAFANVKPSGQAVIGLSQEPTVFDPRRPHIEVDDGIYMALFSPLWAVDPSGRLLPRLAAEIPTVENGGISKDGLSWSIKLRDGVKWHDGTPFTAGDVKYTIESIIAPDFPAFSRVGHEMVEDIQTPAPDRIVWKMKKAFAPYVSILATTYIVPKHLLAGQPITGGPFVQHPIGTGPFKWHERVPGDHITLQADEDYFGDGPLLDTVIYKYIPDLTVLYTQFQTGGIDYIGLQGILPDHYEQAVKLPDRKVVKAPQAVIECFYFNLGLAKFQDKAVRHALYHAYDKKSIIEQLYYGLPSPAESYLPKQSWAYNAHLPKHEYSLEKAQKILDSAGWKRGGDGVREKDGVRLSFLNSTTAGNQLREQVQQLLQQDFRQIGVEMKIHNLPAAVMWGKYWVDSQFETAIVGLDFMKGSDPDATAYFASRSIPAKTKSGQNTMQYSSAKADALLTAGAETLDREKRVPIYQKLQATLRDDLPFLPQHQYAEIEGTKAKLLGYAPNINARINLWNLETWHWA